MIGHSGRIVKPGWTFLLNTLQDKSVEGRNMCTKRGDGKKEKWPRAVKSRVCLLFRGMSLGVIMCPPRKINFVLGACVPQGRPQKNTLHSLFHPALIIGVSRVLLKSLLENQGRDTYPSRKRRITTGWIFDRQVLTNRLSMRTTLL